MNPTRPRSSWRKPGRRPPPRAYTLQELLIVVTILASVAAIAWPAVRLLLGRSSQRDAALQLAAEFAEARELAIRHGTAQELRVVPGTGYYSLAAPSPSDALQRREARPVDAVAGAVPGPWSGSEPEQAEQARCELADGVIFVTSPPRPDARRAPADSLEAESFESIDLGSAEDLDGCGIVAAQFFPDGRSTDSVIELTVPGSRETTAIHLRGLTGGVIIRAGASSAARLNEAPLPHMPGPDGARP